MPAYSRVVLPTRNPLLGHLQPVLNDLPTFIAEEVAPCGDLVRVRVGPTWITFINHPDLIGEMLVKRANAFNKADIAKSLAGRSINLFSGDGDFWRGQRKLVQPAFHAKRVETHTEMIVTETRHITADWRPGMALDINEVMLRLTMKIILRAMFGQHMPTHSQHITRLMQTLFEIAGKRARRGGLPPYWLPTPENFRLRRTIAAIFDVFQEVMAGWRVRAEDRGDVLSALMMARYDDGSPMSDRQIIHELTTLVSAGHDTTAHTLSFAWYLLSQYPDAEAQLHAELDSVLSGRPPTLADLPRLPYTLQVLKETMRLYCPAHTLMRQANQPTEIGGYPVKKGEMLMTSMWTPHYDPRWFPNPKVFDPARFSPANEANIRRYSYFPFGLGPRVCVGAQFAMLEAQLVLATLASRFRFRLQPGAQITPYLTFTVGPANGVPVFVEQRRIQ